MKLSLPLLLSSNLIFHHILKIFFLSFCKFLVEERNPSCKPYPSSGGVGPERCRKAYGQTWTFKPWPTKKCCPMGDMRGREIIEGKPMSFKKSPRLAARS